MEISSNGYKIPVDTDTSFFDYLVYNFNRLNSHKHDGDDSDNIPSSSVTREKQDVLDDFWVASGEMFVQEITLPDPYTFDNSNIHFVDTVSGEEIHPKYVKIDDTSFNLYSPYSTSVWEIWYG
jgi:hypothetical protein